MRTGRGDLSCTAAACPLGDFGSCPSFVLPYNVSNTPQRSLVHVLEHASARGPMAVRQCLHARARAWQHVGHVHCEAMRVVRHAA